MKKIVFAMAAMLSAAAFVSCSNTEVFEEGAAEKAKVQQVETQYKTDFVKHFGDVAPNQSWDFSQSNVPEVQEEVAKTRALFYTQLPAPTWKKQSIGERLISSIFQTINEFLTGEQLYPFAATDYPEVQAILNKEGTTEALPVEDWPYEYAQINLHPFYTHGETVLNYYFLGVQYKQKDSWGTYPKNNAFMFQSMGNKWTSIVSLSKFDTNWNKNGYIEINTTNMEGVDGFKWFTASRNTDYFSAANNTNTLTKCKQFVVNNHTYVAFDCNNDGKYWDLVCWVEDLSPAKRYMVEDLGKTDDFDFNDIVFDVVRKEGTGVNGKPAKYECLVRAMGGTLDFTLKLGNTTWTKSNEENGFNVKTMYNTQDKDYNTSKILARFDVDGWVPANNDVTVTVVGKEGIFVLPFPKNGEIPFIVCTSVSKDWSKERVDVQTIGWFGSVVNDGKIEVEE